MRIIRSPFPVPKSVLGRLFSGVAGSVLALMGILPCHAGGLDGIRQPDPPSASPVENYFSDWFARVSKTQAEQPHWITPLVTVTPRLEQELRYDQLWETVPGE